MKKTLDVDFLVKFSADKVHKPNRNYDMFLHQVQSDYHKQAISLLQQSNNSLNSTNEPDLNRLKSIAYFESLLNLTGMNGKSKTVE